MPTHLVRLSKSLIILLLLLLLVIGAVRLVITDPYLAFAYRQADFPPDPFGFTTEQRLALASANFRYVREGQPIEALADQRLNGTPLYNRRELDHMQDVQNVYHATWRVWQVALSAVVLAGLAFIGWRLRGRGQAQRVSRQRITAYP